MKKYNILLALTALIVASLACQTVMGGDSLPNIPPDDGGEAQVPTLPSDGGGGMELPTVPPASGDDNNGYDPGEKSDFPIPDDAMSFMDMGDGLVTFQTKLTLEEVMKFYQDQFGKLGYAEQTSMTFVADNVFSMSFDDAANGRLISVQGVGMANGVTSVTIMASKK